MKLTAGEKAPNQVNVCVEIPAGSSVKYELDKASGAIVVDRFLYTAFSYPFNYGFIPETHADDGDPIDVLVLCEKALLPGVVIPSVPIGLLEMEDEEGVDTKIIAVPPAKIDPLYGAYKDISDVPEPIKQKIKHFFERYKDLEPEKWVKIREWRGKKEAIDAIKMSMK
ncbi:MAG: inorganic diphosphatase [Patescibacteria group bacterium]|nr:inorganic diphosphatase [Patescibacteria group bacterium]